MNNNITLHTIALYNKFIEEISKEFDFKGFVISNLSQLNFVDKNKELIANYNLNIAKKRKFFWFCNWQKNV